MKEYPTEIPEENQDEAADTRREEGSSNQSDRNIVDLSSDSSPNQIWPLDGCDEGMDEFMLECSKCKRLMHYACTKLPANQLALFMTKNYRLYQCMTCVGDVHEDYIANCTQNTNEEIAEVKLKCKKLQDEVIEKSRIIATNGEEKS